MLDKIKLRYHQQKMNARNRTDVNGNPIEFRLTFEEWFDIWEKSGKWDLRGKSKDSYVMCRYNDIGHYEVGNVYIDKHVDNASEGAKRGNKGQFQKGHVFTEETKKKFSEAQKKRWTNVDRENTEFWKPSKEQCEKLKEVQKKAWQNPERKEKARLRMLNQKLEEVTCPHCNKVGKGGSMRRWHFDNCKQKI